MELSKQLKNTKIFKEYGYVLKKDLVDVYQKEKQLKRGED